MLRPAVHIANAPNHRKHPSEVTRNLNALQLALSGAPRPSKAAPIYINTSSGSHQSRAHSTSLSTVSGLISFPLYVPKSVICHQTELRFLADIPGLQFIPQRKRGLTVDEEVLSKSTLIRHVSSRSSNGWNSLYAIWHQNR